MINPEKLDNYLTSFVRKLNSYLIRKRRIIKYFASVLLVVGLIISGKNIDIQWGSFSAVYFGLLIIFVSFTLSIASLSYVVSGKAVGVNIKFLEGVLVSALGSIAEIFPGPGGAVVRGASLVGSGASASKSGGIVAVGAVLMLSIAFVLGSTPLLMLENRIGSLFLISGMIGIFGCAFWLLKRIGVQLIGSMILLRTLGIFTSIFRVWACFEALGFMINPVDAALFVISITVGSAVTIVPAGLGVSEVLGAALGVLVAVPPGEAFIALALNRVVGLAICGIVAAVLSKFHPISRRLN